MPLPKMSPRMFLELGMDVKGVAHQRSGRRRNVGRFIAWYGTEPYICSIVRDKLVISGYLHGHKGEPKHFLWALHFLKCYSTEANNAASVGGVDEKTFRKHAWFYAKGIASLVTSVVSITPSISCNCSSCAQEAAPLDCCFCTGPMGK